MIKYTVMDFEDVKEFQKFKIIGDSNAFDYFIKLPRFFEMPTMYLYDYNEATKDMSKDDYPTFEDNPKIKNAYAFDERYPNRNRYVFIENNIECIVDYR